MLHSGEPMERWAIAFGYTPRDNVVYLPNLIYMPIRSVNITEVEAGALRELSNRFPASDLASKAARNAAKSRCARLAGGIGKDEVAVLRRGTNRIDVLNYDEYFRDSHRSLWDF